MNMMTSQLITPAQLEHANALLGVWLGDRSECRLDHAVAAIEQADREEQALHGRATAGVVSTLLALRGFREDGCVRLIDRHEAIPVYRRGFTRHESGKRGAAAAARSRQVERREGLAYARDWRRRNKPIFDAIHGSGDGDGQ